VREFFTLPSQIESVDLAATRADEFAKRAGLDESFISSIDLAVRESVANAIKHGNRLEADKVVEIELVFTEGCFEMKVRDFGAGFDATSVPDPTDPENLLKATGRGILFMKAFMDKVIWETHKDGGTVVHLIKNL
jgi:serine/threonine-protein kinase RsbW